MDFTKARITSFGVIRNLSESLLNDTVSFMHNRNYSNPPLFSTVKEIYENFIFLTNITSELNVLYDVYYVKDLFEALKADCETGIMENDKCFLFAYYMSTVNTANICERLHIDSVLTLYGRFNENNSALTLDDFTKNMLKRYGNPF